MRGIMHKRKVTSGLQRTEFDLSGTRGNLANNRWDHRSRRLARAIGVEGPQHADRGAKSFLERKCKLVRPDLNFGIGRLGVQRVFFGNRHKLRGAIDL